MTDDVSETEAGTRPASRSRPEEEPVITGTIFLTTLLLIMIFGFWIMMYLTLLER